ncbi:hypothetical protein GGR32_000298 [Mesonia hippocampi]|uniref:SAM-dependent chlorinase/fluorinase n=1 Tax=Mesonia hippocampi TaxID=1628250 RepID=A0A840ERP5_9FLAO|nr:SAM-dependent chlorinase/fluorinase [Mesonia hippocampi]MBB4118026.1 hypothetical protein [Mesonia hippocampi]
MAIITLTSDFGYKDPSTAMVKGTILCELPNANIVDISHDISPFHIMEAAYVIKNAYKSFPKGSIHIISVDTEQTYNKKQIALFMDGHYFICANNGVLSLVASEINPDKIVEINIQENKNPSFPTLDTFVKVACHIARGGSLDVIGKNVISLEKLKAHKPIIYEQEQKIIAHIIYIDNYGNLVTNVSKKLFNQIGKGQTFIIDARSNKFTKIVASYSEVIKFDTENSNLNESGKKIALFNTASYLELAIYKSNPKTVGGAASLFGLGLSDTVTIKFN